MLLYNVAYLAYTQNVNIPLHQVAAGDVLGNLWAVCLGSSGLGRLVSFLFFFFLLRVSIHCASFIIRLSHETTSSFIPNPCSFPLPYLSPPTPRDFGLEFGQLLQAASRPRVAATQTPTPTQSVNPDHNGTAGIATTTQTKQASIHTRVRTSSEVYSQSTVRPGSGHRRRASDVSLAKDIVKIRDRADDKGLNQVFEDDEDDWDLL